MAIKGLRKPIFGRYAYDGAKAVYTEGFVCGSAVEYGVEIESSDNNPLYGDDAIIENDYGSMSGGTLTLNTSHLDAETSKKLLNIKEVGRTVGETTVKELVYDDDAKSTPFGFGIVETHQINDVDKFRAVILAKVTMSIPAEAATTKGESVEWQTKEIEGTISRSDEESENYKHPWKMEAWFDTFTEAFNYLKAVLGVTEAAQASAKTKGK